MHNLGFDFDLVWNFSSIFVGLSDHSSGTDESNARRSDWADRKN
jgi:hypothetical protein